MPGAYFNKSAECCIDDVKIFTNKKKYFRVECPASKQTDRPIRLSTK